MVVLLAPTLVPSFLEPFDCLSVVCQYHTTLAKLDMFLDVKRQTHERSWNIHIRCKSFGGVPDRIRLKLINPRPLPILEHWFESSVYYRHGHRQVSLLRYDYSIRLGGLQPLSTWPIVLIHTTQKQSVGTIIHRHRVFSASIFCYFLLEHPHNLVRIV